MAKRYISWEWIEGAVCEIASQARADMGSISGVYGLPRGGLVPAVMLSHVLGVPLLAAACPDCLVVDDIADSGVTLKHYKDCGYKTAVVWYKTRSEVRPDYYWKENDTSDWIVFPWEIKH